MPDDKPTRGFGKQLYQKLQEKGLSKGQIDKVLALQRLDPEVAELGAKGLLSEGHLLEISRIAAAPRQKQLAEIAVEKDLSIGWVRELSKLVRTAEKAPDKDASRYWDFFFEVEDRLDHEGPSHALLRLVKNFSLDKTPPPAASPDSPSDDRSLVAFDKLELELGRGLDVGTVNIASSARKSDGSSVFNIQRNAFLDVRNDAFTKKMLMKLGIDYVYQERSDRGYVIGDPAFELANIFEKNTRRPMKDGMISPVEPEALLIVSLLVAQLLGHPQEVGEICAFSVPADPIDAERNVIYHRGALETVLRKLGYTPKPVLEGHAVVFAELAAEQFTGIGISCGGGMFNVCVAYKSVPALTFSTSRGGDWIDQNVSTVLGIPIPQVCALKESGVDLRKPKDRVEEAVAIYYRNLIQYTLETIRREFERAHSMPTFSHPIEIVCAGGTSLAPGFIDLFRDEFAHVEFPLEVRSIRLARDPLRAVAEGCLQAAIEETKALKEIQKTTEVMIGRAEITKEVQFDEGTKRRIRQVLTNHQNPPAMKPDTEKIVAQPAPLDRSGAGLTGPATPKGDTAVRAARAIGPDAEKVVPMNPLPPPPKTEEVPLEELPPLEEVPPVEEVPTVELDEVPAPPPPAEKPDEPRDLPLIS